MGGKSSSRGGRVASNASSDFGEAGSMISLSPSFRMMASSPGSSNSRGIHTAWFRPFLKSLTCRSEIAVASSCIGPSICYVRSQLPAAACIAVTVTVRFSIEEELENGHRFGLRSAAKAGT